MSLAALRKELHALANPERGEFAERFFKTAKGQYGAGDKFLGIPVPAQRKVAKQYRHLPEKEVLALLHNKWHEERLVALFILVDQFKQGDEVTRQHIYELYLQNTAWINNWDLVDSSAHKIVGAHLIQRDRERLYRLAKSPSLWERRIAIIATHAFVAEQDFQDTFRLTELMLDDKQDLIQKACGWLLREVGKRDRQALVDFMQKHYQNMPRTMLRYAIEHFPPEVRKAYLLGKI